MMPHQYLLIAISVGGALFSIVNAIISYRTYRKLKGDHE